MSLVIVVIKINAKHWQLHACVQVPAASTQIELAHGVQEIVARKQLLPRILRILFHSLHGGRFDASQFKAELTINSFEV